MNEAWNCLYSLVEGIMGEARNCLYSFGSGHYG